MTFDLRAGTDSAKGVTLEEIKIAGPYARVVVNTDKSVNLAMVAKSDAAPALPASGPAPASPSAAPSAAPPPKIAIGEVVISFREVG